MSLINLLKISRTLNMVVKKHVRSGTPRAVKDSQEDKLWYAYRRDSKKQIKL